MCLAAIETDPLDNSCIDDFEFLAITHQSRFEYQGVFGISPSNLTNEGPSYLQALKTQGKIDSAMISFSLGHHSKLHQEDFPSYVIFGGIDRNEYTGPLYTFYLQNEYYWAPEINGIAYKNHLYMPLDIDTQKNINIALFDTGASFIHIPKYMHEVLVDFWKQDLDLHDDEFFVGRGGLWEANVDGCASIYDRLGNFTIILGDHTFELVPKAYLIEC